MKEKQYIIVYRLHDSRYLEDKPLAIHDIGEWTADQVAKLIRLIDNEPEHVWVFQKRREGKP